MWALAELRAEIERLDVDGVLSDWYALIDRAESGLIGVGECVVDVTDDAYRCRACGAFMARDGLTDLCEPIRPRHCANCGRRIAWER